MTLIRRNAALVLLAGMLWPSAAPLSQDNAAAPRLSLPIRCVPGRDCWLVNNVDLDPGPGVRDYTCAKRSYVGH